MFECKGPLDGCPACSMFDTQLAFDMLPNYEVEYFDSDGLVIPDDVNKREE